MVEDKVFYTHKLIQRKNSKIVLRCLRNFVDSKNSNDVLYLYCSYCKTHVDVKGVTLIESDGSSIEQSG